MWSNEHVAHRANGHATSQRRILYMHHVQFIVVTNHGRHNERCHCRKHRAEKKNIYRERERDSEGLKTNYRMRDLSLYALGLVGCSIEFMLRMNSSEFYHKISSLRLRRKHKCH